MTQTHRCPICYRTVQPTRAHCIAGHYDKAHHICPASYRDFDITLTDQPTTTKSEA